MFEEKIPKKFAHLKLPYSHQLRWKTLIEYQKRCYRVSYVIPSAVIFASAGDKAGMSRWLFFSDRYDKWAVLINSVGIMELHLSNGMLTKSNMNQSMSEFSKNAIDWIDNKLALPDRPPQAPIQKKKKFLDRIKGVLCRYNK